MTAERDRPPLPEWQAASRLLVVDDDAMHVELLRRLLAAHGYRDIVATTDPIEVRALLASRQFDLVVLDLQMPVVSGLEILEWMGTAQLGSPPPPAIMLTAATEIEPRRRALELGAAEFLTKPFDAVEVVLRIRSILDRQRLQIELTNRVEELRQANEDISRFAFAAVHDLSHPLTVIGANAHILRNRLTLDAPTTAALGRLDDGVQAMRDILDAFLAYARSGGTVAIEDVDAAEALTRALQALQPKIEARGAVVKAGALPVVRAERTRLIQVFQNLLDNAMTYVELGRSPRISVAAARGGGAWEVEVVDNGIGIAPSDAHRVFGLLERLDAGRAVSSGSGIGLAVCKQMVESWGGTIRVEPADGGGSRFVLVIPDALADS